jgi:hypothetical protein
VIVLRLVDIESLVYFSVAGVGSLWPTGGELDEEATR